MTHLCVPIFINDVAKAAGDITAGVAAGADLIELRVDRFADLPAIRQLAAHAGRPCIVTCRPVWEGGHCELPEEDRLSLLSSMATSGDATYVDVELAAYRKTAGASLPRDRRAGLILSAHDFQGRPDKLYNLIQEMNDAAGDVNKIAWTARTVRDNIEVFEILQQRSRPTIALCMGEAGIISRILAGKFGAFLTFASLDAQAATAPGQVSIDDMKGLYRWDAVRRDTKVYGVVAHPVMHSMSPAVHNAAFDAIGYDGVYVPLLVNPGYESFKAFMESAIPFSGLDLSGLSVTLPHKENALRYLQEKNAEIEELARRIGAVNTIAIDRSASEPALRGMNTDYAAILDSITARLGIGRDRLADYRVAVLGAGGTGRTAVAALAHYGATVVVYNRTQEKADALAAEFNGKSGKVVAAPMEKLCNGCCHVYINTTSIGMHPHVEQSPFDASPPKLTPETVVFDTVYNPMETRLLKQARSAGASTIGGVEMFVRQASAQFQAWTGQPAPTDVMRGVIEKRLSL